MAALRRKGLGGAAARGGAVAEGVDGTFCRTESRKRAGEDGVAEHHLARTSERHLRGTCKGRGGLGEGLNISVLTRYLCADAD